MEVVSQPDGKPFVVDTDTEHGHRNGQNYGQNYGFGQGFGGYGPSSFETNSRFADSQTSQAAISKDVAVLSRDVVISEGRLAVQIGTVTKDIAVLGRDLALAEARLTLVAAQNAAAAAECCCELKALILQENGATRQLMQSDRIRELELKLAANGVK